MRVARQNKFLRKHTVNVKEKKRKLAKSANLLGRRRNRVEVDIVVEDGGDGLDRRRDGEEDAPHRHRAQPVGHNGRGNECGSVQVDGWL